MNIVSNIIIGLFILIFIPIAISKIVNLIKSKRYKKVKANVILKTAVGSEEWIKYFPEEYEKMLNVVEKINKFGGIISKVNERFNNTISSINDRREKDGKIIFTEKEIHETIIVEYVVDGKKYYYYEKTIIQIGNKDSFAGMVGKTIDLFYDPKNPKKIIRKDIEIKILILSISITTIFSIVFYLINFYN